MAVLKAFEGKPFTVLAFPCNEFLDQEPKSNTAIHQYAKDTWNFTAPMFAKSNVNAKCNGEADSCRSVSHFVHKLICACLFY
jgi:glutathione peroxidase-family protein